MSAKGGKISTQNFLERLLEDPDNFPVNTKDDSLGFLIQFFNQIRPTKKEGKEFAENKLQAMIALIEERPLIGLKLQRAVMQLLVNTQLESAFTQSGIPLSGDFWAELIKRLKHKILPEQPSKDDFLYVINAVFFKPSDYLWVHMIKRSSWIYFFELLQFPIQASDERLRNHLLDAMIILSIQIANTGLQKEISGYISPVASRQDDPFIVQRRNLLELQQQINSHPKDLKTHANALKIVLHELENEIDYIKRNQGIKGTSIKQSYSLLILGVRLKRMLLLLDAIDNDESFDVGMFVDLFQIIVRNEKRRNSLIELTSQAVGFVAYQIAEHKGIKGGKYITTTRKEYANMMLSAMGGGIFICFAVVIKVLLGWLHYAHFWQGFWYSINYSAAFVGIDQSGSTLATKQPAFTANAVAVSLDTKKNVGKPDLQNLAVTVAKVFRSQVASFIGNLIIVFPGSYFLAWGYHQIFGSKLVEGTAALQMLQDQHPFQSLTWLYACNTGVFLFASGIIAGYIQNKIRFGGIADRIAGNPSFHLKMERDKRLKWAHFVEKNAGSYAGNISLGFFLGMAGSFGQIFGIPFDIRHITISSGNMALGVYGLGFDAIPINYLATVFMGVLGVGFFNFLVSFSLAFFVAIKARGIKLNQYPELIGIILGYFFQNPLAFLIPPRTAKQSNSVVA